MREAVQPRRREGAGWRRRSRRARARERARLKAGGVRARAERTWNMLIMFVTLDVSKLSGWLNTFADCRGEKRAYDAGRGTVRQGVKALGGGDANGGRARGGPDSRLGGQGTRGAHEEHIAHVCDLGRVEAERLVERRRVLYRVTGIIGLPS